MVKWIASFILVLWATAAQADYRTIPNVTEGIDSTLCSEFFPDEIMDNEQRNLLTICRLNYAVIYDRDCRIPLLTFENLRPDEVDGAEPRVDRFRTDPSLMDRDSASLTDYANSGYDRGHMVPASDMREDTASMRQSFYLSNIVPQAPSVNRGVWRTIENKARRMVTEFNGDTYIVTGAIVSQHSPRIGDGVCVPTALYKIVIQNNTARAFMVPNQPGATSVRFSITDILAFSGFEFDR